MLSRYNKIYLVDLRMTEVEDALWEAHLVDYENFIKLYPDFDTTITKPMSEDFDYMVKRAGYVINWHYNSKWVDDSYLYVGRARYYAGDIAEAKSAYRFVNQNTESKDEQVLSLVYLMQAQLYENDLIGAEGSLTQIEARGMGDKVATEYYKTRATYHIRQQEYDYAIASLEPALETVKDKKDKARIYYLLGQLYYYYGEDSLAYESFRRVPRLNPGYDLEFYAAVNMAKSTSLDDPKSIAELNLYFDKLLKDPNNEEYQDKIYYEKAKFAFKQKKIDEGIDYLKKSVRTSAGNERQKAYSYLLLADTYYYDKDDFKSSKIYYDSAVGAISPKDPDYNILARRKKILTAFVQEYDIIQLEDSLQLLADLGEEKLDKYLDKVIEDDCETQRLAFEAEKERQKEIKRLQEQQSQDVFLADNKKTIAFPRTESELQRTKVEFKKIWGDVPLTDNWRRSAANPTTIENADNQPIPETDPGKEEFECATMDKGALLATVPVKPEDREASNRKLLDATYEMGKIYHLRLFEQEKAEKTFEGLLKRFPKSKYEPEVLYFLSRIYAEEGKTEKQKEVEQQLYDYYPTTDYAKLIRNPDYKKDLQEADEKVKELYNEAYELFNKAYYEDAIRVIDEINTNYPENTYKDRTTLLRILIIGQSQGITEYLEALDYFMNNFQESPLMNYARSLRATAKRMEASLK